MPSLFLVLSLVFQAALIVHCIKTGRNQIWIWVLALLSMAGVIAYVAAELIPDLLRSRTTQRTVTGVKKALDPQADLRRYENAARLTGNVDSQQRYADELIRHGQAGNAIKVCQDALRGLYEHDAGLLLTLARAQFEAGQASAARATLDLLIEHNPQFKSPDGHLLYARALEAEGDDTRALAEFKVLAGYYPGAEGTVRYAQLLARTGDTEGARTVLRELLDRAQNGPQHYRRTQADWLAKATQQLATL